MYGVKLNRIPLFIFIFAGPPLGEKGARTAVQAKLLAVQAKGIGHTALHWAASAGHVQVVEWLISVGGDVNAKVGTDPTHTPVSNANTPLSNASMPISSANTPVSNADRFKWSSGCYRWGGRQRKGGYTYIYTYIYVYTHTHINTQLPWCDSLR